MRLFKKLEYVLLDLETEEEAGRYKDPFLIGDARRMMKSGEIDEGIYALVEYNVKNGEQKPLWKMKQKKKLTADEAAKLDREKALQAVNDRADSLKAEVLDFEEFRDGVLKKFGFEGEERIGSEVDIPDSVDSIRKALNMGMSRALYRDIMGEPGKMGSNFFKMFEGVNELINSGAKYLSNKVDEVNSKSKEEANKEKKVEKEVETREDGTTITRFKRKKEEVEEVMEEELPINPNDLDIDEKEAIIPNIIGYGGEVCDEVEPEIIRGRVINDEEEHKENTPIKMVVDGDTIYSECDAAEIMATDEYIAKHNKDSDVHIASIDVDAPSEKELDIDHLEEKLKELEDKRREDANQNSVKKKNKSTKRRKKK